MERIRTFQRASWKELRSIDFASQKLAEQTKKVVEEALRLISDIPPNDFGNAKVLVKDPKTGNGYLITDTEAGEALEKTSLTSKGIYIQPVTLNEREKLIGLGRGIMAPRDPQKVNQSTIFHLRGINPDAMRAAAKELRRAIPIA